jgi:hypothetical protein
MIALGTEMISIPVLAGNAGTRAAIPVFDIAVVTLLDPVPQDSVTTRRTRTTPQTGVVVRRITVVTGFVGVQQAVSAQLWRRFALTMRVAAITAAAIPVVAGFIRIDASVAAKLRGRRLDFTVSTAAIAGSSITVVTPFDGRQQCPVTTRSGFLLAA